MNERYSRLFTLPENLYALGSPVVIAAGALLKDNQTGKVIAQLKLQNISTKAIKAATVFIKPFDTVGHSLGDPIRYHYLDLTVRRDGYFGSKTAIFLTDITTRSFSATVQKIVFADNTVWMERNDPWEPLSAPTAIRSTHDAEFAKQFCLEYGTDCKYFPSSEKDLWHCACGALNRQKEGLCHSCGEAFSAISRYNVDELKQNKDKRLAYEKETAEIKSRVKRKRIVCFVAICVCMVFAVGIFWLYNRPVQVELIYLGTDKDTLSAASSIPKSADYLHFAFVFKGPLNEKAHTLRHRVQWPGTDSQLADWVWEDVKAWVTCGAEWPAGYSVKKTGILVIEILDDDTGEILGEFEIEVK